jgi:class 3 adenylate cyclase
LAVIHARQLDTDCIGMAVWDGKKGDGRGGTATVVARWQDRQQQEVQIINPATVIPAASALPRRPTPPAPLDLAPGSRDSDATEIQVMMFIDVVQFTKLTEEQMPAFVEHFLYRLGALASVSPDRPIVQETRGDGVFFAFDRVAKAGNFALEVRDRLRGISWSEHGLPADFRVRIGLHAGPVFQFLCPFTKRLSFTGHHVSRAARIEQETPHGEVYASQEFAALAAEENITDFACEYAGRLPLAKGFGTFPLFHLRRCH